MVEKFQVGVMDIVNALALPAAVIGPDMRIIAANAGFARVVSAGAVGRPFISVLRQPSIIDAVEAVVVGADAQTTGYTRRLGGTDVSFEVHVAQAGNSVLVTLADRTDAEQIGRMRTDFIANVSHELRTPLTALMGFIETLRGAARDDADARDRFLAIMEQEAGRMTTLVDELMTLSRLEETERRQPTATVVLGDVINAAIAGMTPIAQAAGVSLVCVQPDGILKTLGDAAQLQQVLTNLIENAIKYAGQGKDVRIETAQIPSRRGPQPTDIRITVTDQGAGVAAHHIARLTERFYRVDNHRSRSVGGIGLGLAIVKHIVSRHRGHLKINSQIGEGTTVTVTLPAI